MEHNRQRSWMQSVFSLVLVVSTVIALFPLGNTAGVTRVQAAPARTVPYLQNGSFENYTGGVPDNWTVTNGRVNLGVDSLGGCVTQDTTDYARIFTRDVKYGTVPVWPFPSGPGAKPTADNDAFTGVFSSNSVTVVGTNLVPTEGSKSFLMTIASGSGTSGHVVHGPAVVSDEFRGIQDQVITMNWYSAAGGDDFAVLGYLLDTSTCTQTTIFETTGTSIASWQYASVVIPATADTYRFVFVSGTFDKSGGTASGSKFWLDNISQGDPQTVSFSLSGVTANYGSGWITAPFQLTATSTSSLPVTYTSLTTTKCTVTSSGMVTIVGAGTCTIAASQSGGEDSGTLWAAAPIVSQSFTIGSVAATAQTITFATPADVLATAADFTLGATTTSPLAVTYTSSTPSVCTVTSAGTVTLVAPGTCTIVAAQAGGASGGTTYAPATNVTRSFAAMDVQTITFGALGDKDPTAANFSVSATSSSGLAVTYTSSTASVCTVTSGGTVDVLTPGTCTIVASQVGGTTGGIKYTAATPVNQSFTVRTGQTITFAAPSPVDQDAADFALTATSDSGLAVTYTSSTPGVCTVTSSGTVTMVTFGTCTIVAAQIGGTNSGTDYAAATSVTRSFISRKLQTITFGALSDKNPTAADFAVTATADSGLAVTFTSSTTGVCTVTSGGTVGIVAPGTCTIVAAQAGGLSGGVTYAVAPTVSQSFTVRTGQVITFAAPSPVNQDVADFTLSGTSDSGLAVTYTSSTPSVCTVTSAGTVTMVSFGTCTITAAQAGGTNSGTDYAAATSVTRSFISRKLQTITFGALSDKNPTAADFALSATADSTLAVTYSTTTSSVCTVTSGGNVSIVAPGTCTIDANQAGGLVGGTTYAVAPTVSQSFTVRTPQTITFGALSTVDENAADFALTATASSTLAVTYTSSTPSVCTVTSSGTVTMVSFGTCTIVAAQIGGEAGGTKYAPAATVTQSFTSRKLQTITFTVLSDKSIFEPPFTLAATASSGLAVTYTSSTTSVCTVTSSGTVTLVTTGTCTITANQAGGLAGGVTYAVAPAVSQTFSILTIQTITFNQPADRASTAPSFAIGATASSGLPVTYVSATPTICTVTSSGTVTLVTFGTCTITASQVGGTKDGTLYEAAHDVSRSFLSLKNQTVTFPALADKVYTAANYNITATASSTLPVTFSSTTPTICTVTSSGTVDLLLPGTCSINAVAAAGTAGGVAYAGSPVATQSFTVNAVAQSISFPVPPESHLYQVGADMIALSSSTLGVIYTSLTPEVCTVVGKKVSFITIGKCTIKASQPGGTSGGTIYGAASDVTRDFFVTNYTATFTVTPTNTRTFTPTLTPTPIPFLMKKGAVGASFVLGLLQNNTLITWGMNKEYQTNIPPCCGSGITDVAVGTNFALALKGGKVYGWGANTKGQLKLPASVAKDITSIAAGAAHGLALTKAGVVIAWGDNGYKQSQVPKGLKAVKSMAGGAAHTVVVLTDGTVAAWGSNALSQAKAPLGLKGVTMVSAGLDHNLALKSDGTVVSWGGNSYGQASVPSNAIDVKQVSAGTQFSMAVKSDGTVLAWGRNDYNQTYIPPEYTDVYSAFAGYANTILGLRSGRVIVLGDQSNGIDASRTPTKTATPTP